MSITIDEEIKRWMARRKSALVLEIIQGKTTVSEASRQFDPAPSEIEEWIEQGKAGMENALRAKPEDVREQYEREMKTLMEAYGEAMLELRVRKKNTVPAGQGRAMIEGLRQGLKDDGVTDSISKLRQWFNFPRRTVYYKPCKVLPRLNRAFVEPIKTLIEDEPSFGYHTVANLLGFNKNTVQRIFQLKGWEVRKRPVCFRPRIEALPSFATRPDERWATDLCRVWGGHDGWLTLALMIGCHLRELLGWQLSRMGRASTASAALEQVLISRFGSLEKVASPFLLRADNGLVFTSRHYMRMVRGYGLKQELITPHCPQQNGLVERFVRTLKEQCVHRHRFESPTDAVRVIGEWITFYNNRRPHQALGMITPAQAYELTA